MPTLSRRTLLAQLACLGCKGIGERGTNGSPVPSPWRLAIGLNGFGSSETHHGKRYDYDEILRFARDEGFEGIELWRGWREGYPDPDDDDAIQASRDKIESYGLQVFSIQGGVRGVNPVSDDASERAEYTRGLQGQVELAVKFGCDAIGLWSAGRVPDQVGEDQLIERFAEVLRPAIRYAVDSGILPAIEGEPPLLVNSAARYHKLFAMAGMDELKVIFDPSHFDLLNGRAAGPRICFSNSAWTESVMFSSAMATQPSGRSPTEVRAHRGTCRAARAFTTSPSSARSSTKEASGDGFRWTAGGRKTRTGHPSPARTRSSATWGNESEADANQHGGGRSKGSSVLAVRPSKGRPAEPVSESSMVGPSGLEPLTSTVSR